MPIINFKGGKSKFKRGGEQPHIKDRVSQLVRGGQINPRGSESTP